MAGSWSISAGRAEAVGEDRGERPGRVGAGDAAALGSDLVSPEEPGRVGLAEQGGVTDKRLIACHDHNETASAAGIVKLIEDGATVHALFQAHSFEDRVLKIDYVRLRARCTVGRGAVVLYGADVGEDSHVMPNSVIMKRERLLPRRRYAGAPTDLVS